jgi:hypothetical protein
MTCQLGLRLECGHSRPELLLLDRLTHEAVSFLSQRFRCNRRPLGTTLLQLCNTLHDAFICFQARSIAAVFLIAGSLVCFIRCLALSELLSEALVSGVR